jgi:hypothetical protein
MSSNDADSRKRKPTNIVPASVPSNEDHNPMERKARRVSTDASASNAAPLQVNAFAATANTVSAATEDEESIKSIGALIQDLFRSDNAKVHAALDALFLGLGKDKKKCDNIQAVGGCFALVHLMQNCLKKARKKILACNQVTKLNELAELTTLDKTLDVIIRLTFQHYESKVGIAAIGGVEAAVKVMKTFPKCQVLQERACTALTNLSWCSCSIGKAKAIESGGIQVLLAAINNHLNSSLICERACKVLVKIASDSKENTGRLIISGGGATVEKVRTKWPDDSGVQTQVRKLANLFGAEWNARADEE